MATYDFSWKNDSGEWDYLECDEDTLPIYIAGIGIGRLLDICSGEWFAIKR